MVVSDMGSSVVYGESANFTITATGFTPNTEYSLALMLTGPVNLNGSMNFYTDGSGNGSTVYNLGVESVGTWSLTVSMVGVTSNTAAVTITPIPGSVSVVSDLGSSSDYWSQLGFTITLNNYPANTSKVLTLDSIFNGSVYLTVNFGTVTTDSNGYFSYDYKPNWPKLAGVWGGRAAFGYDVSNIASVTVAPNIAVLSISSDAGSSTPHGTNLSFTVSGTNFAHSSTISGSVITYLNGVEYNVYGISINTDTTGAGSTDISVGVMAVGAWTASASISGVTSNTTAVAVTPPFVGALDAITTPISFGVSVRRLTSSYSGPLMQIVRASDSAVLDIGYLSNGDLDTASIATFIGSSSGQVMTWYDQSGNGNHVTQHGNGGPTIYAFGSGITQSGKPALAWSGQYLTTVNQQSTLPAGSSPVTVSAVAMLQNSITSLQAYFSYGYWNTNTTITLCSEPNQYLWVSGGNNAIYQTSYSPTAYVQTGTFTSNLITGYINGVEVGTSTAALNTTSPSRIIIGGTADSYPYYYTQYGWSGLTQEIVTFNSNLNTTDLNTLMSLQKTYYSIVYEQLLVTSTFGTTAPIGGDLGFNISVTGYPANSTITGSVTIYKNGSLWANASLPLTTDANGNGSVPAVYNPISSDPVSTWFVRATYGSQTSDSATFTISGPSIGMDVITTPMSFGISMRRLTSGYVGPLLRVQRSIDSAVMDIGFTTSGDLDVSGLTNFVGTSTATIVKWYDQSGNGNDVVATTNGPMIFSGGSINLKNGKPAASFIGGNRYLATAATQSTLASGGNALTVSAVVQSQSQTAYSNYFSYGNDSLNAVRTLAAGAYELQWGVWGADLASAYNLGVLPYIQTGTFTSNLLTGYIDGISYGSTTPALNTPSASTLYIGRYVNPSNPYYWNGNVQEIVTFNSNLNTTDLNTVISSQNTYYTIDPATTLDAITTPIAFGVSIRRLTNKYFGPLIRVQRSSDSTYLDVSYVSNGDLDTAALLAFAGSSNTTVVTWYDQSGNGNHVYSQGSAPLIVSNGTLLVQNSLPALQFNGTSNYLSTAYGQSTLASGSNPLTVSAIAQTTTLTGGPDYFSYGADGTNNARVLGSMPFGLTWPTYANDLYSTYVPSTTSSFMQTGIFTASQTTGYIDGELVCTGSAALTTPPNTKIFIGSWIDISTVALYWPGKVQEVVAFNSALNNTDLNTLMSSQSNYYNPTPIGTNVILSPTHGVNYDHSLGLGFTMTGINLPANTIIAFNVTYNKDGSLYGTEVYNLATDSTGYATTTTSGSGTVAAGNWTIIVSASTAISNTLPITLT